MTESTVIKIYAKWFHRFSMLHVPDYETFRRRLETYANDTVAVIRTVEWTQWRDQSANCVPRIHVHEGAASGCVRRWPEQNPALSSRTECLSAISTLWLDRRDTRDSIKYWQSSVPLFHRFPG